MYRRRPPQSCIFTRVQMPFQPKAPLMNTALPSTFCSRFSQEAGEPLAGTGAHPDRMLLIAWPKAHWTYAMNAARDMPGDLLDAIDAAKRAGWRVNLVDRKTDPAPRGTVFVFPTGERFQVPLPRLPVLVTALVAGGDRGRGGRGSGTALCCAAPMAPMTAVARSSASRPTRRWPGRRGTMAGGSRSGRPRTWAAAAFPRMRWWCPRCGNTGGSRRRRRG